VAGEFDALLTTDTLPVAFPAAVGANATFSVIDWLGARIVPGAMPLALNPEPATVTVEIVTFELPLFISVAPKELLFPTFTLPKFKLVGFAPSSKVEATPVPLKEIASGEPGALLTSESEPVALPPEVGANTTFNVALPPAAMVRGRVRPVMLKPVPVTLA
jgi:hypothetical protein